MIQKRISFLFYLSSLWLLQAALAQHPGNRQFLQQQEWQRANSRANHSAEIKSGQLWVWGRNNMGQLGDSSNINRNAPVSIASNVPWQSVSTGYFHTVAIKQDGSLWAWGNNSAGQIGNGGNTSNWVPQRVGNQSDWVAVSAGYFHTLALKANGTLWAWGDNFEGQIGIGSTGNVRTTPIQIGTSSDWVAISAGAVFSVALKSDGTVWCWGNNGFGQLGNASTSPSSAPISVALPLPAKSIASGEQHVVVLMPNGTLYAWGRNDLGQLGIGNFQSIRNTPALVQAQRDFKEIACGGNHTLAIKADGSLWSWGHNNGGQLGQIVGNNQNLPVRIGARNDWRWITAGELHSIAVDNQGNIYSWGGNDVGQLGDGSNTNRNTLAMLSQESEYWRTIVAANKHSAAIKNNGSLWLWGNAHLGSTGFGDTTPRLLPVRLGIDSNWSAYQSAAAHHLALKANGTLWAWGQQNLAQLGLGDTITRNQPTLVHSSIAWLSFATGSSFSVAIKSDGTLWTWGNNANGQLATGNFSSTLAPQQVGNDSTWIAIAAGDSFFIALKANGTLWAVGANESGQLGLGNNTNRTSMTQIGNENNWKLFSCGAQHVVAIKNNGTLWSWGNNEKGQLGDGLTRNRMVPTRIGNLSDWRYTANGSTHSVAIRQAGRILVCGGNNFGQLGFGDKTNRSSFNQLNAFSQFFAWPGSGYHTILLDPSRTSYCASGLNTSGQLGLNSNYDRLRWKCLTDTSICEKAELTLATPSAAICLMDTILLNPIFAGDVKTFEWSIFQNQQWVTLPFSDHRLQIIANQQMDSMRVSAMTFCGDTTITFPMQITQAPVYTGAGKLHYVCQGDSVIIEGVYTGTGLIYYWQTNLDSTWTNSTFSDSAHFFKTANKTYIRSIAVNHCGADTSKIDTLILRDLVVLDSINYSGAICEGSAFVAYLSKPSLGQNGFWQEWQSGIWSSINSSDSLTINSTEVSDKNRRFRYYKKGHCNADSNIEISPNIMTQTRITSQTTNVADCAGGTIQLNILATGHQLTYHWGMIEPQKRMLIENDTFKGVDQEKLMISRIGNRYSGKLITEVKGTCGSLWSDTFTFSFKRPNATLLQKADTLQLLELADSSRWYNCDSSMAEIPEWRNQNFISGRSGNYAVEVFQEGCRETSSCYRIEVVEDTSGNGTYVNDPPHSITWLMAYPNPFLNNIQIKSAENTLFWLFSLRGELLMSGYLESEKPYLLDLSDLKSGVYFFRTPKAQYRLIKE